MSIDYRNEFTLFKTEHLAKIVDYLIQNNHTNFYLDASLKGDCAIFRFGLEEKDRIIMFSLSPLETPPELYVCKDL